MLARWAQKVGERLPALINRNRRQCLTAACKVM